METAFDLVRMAAERTPHHTAIVDDRSDRAPTYEELVAEIESMAAGLASRGISAGDRFATVLPNVYEHCIVLLALSRLGAVPALINGRLDPSDIATLIEDGAMKGAMLMANPELVLKLRTALPEGAPIFSVGGVVEGAEDCAECRSDANQLPPRPQIHEEDLGFIFYTSGTTGLPKGVMIPARNALARTIWISTQTGISHGRHNRCLGLTPLSHCIGYWGNLLITLSLNGTYYVISQFDPAKAVEMVDEHKITLLFTVPTIFFAMTRAPNYAADKMASLQHTLYGGASILPQTLEQMDKEWGGRIFHIYGTTETMNSGYYPDPVDKPNRLRPGFYANVRLVRFDGEPDDFVGIGEEGELIVDAGADTVFTGYLNRPDATAEKLRNGWYYTGDVCIALEDGEMDFIGRVDDVIRTGGENVHPEEVEAVLQAHPHVAEVSVVAAPDDYWGQIVVACIVVSGEGADESALDAHCQVSTLANFKRPRRYVFLEALPKNAANKVLRRVLREVAAEAG